MKPEIDIGWGTLVTMVTGRRYICIVCGEHVDVWVPDQHRPTDRDLEPPDGWVSFRSDTMFCPEHNHLPDEYLAEVKAYGERAVAATATLREAYREADRVWREENPMPTPPWEK